MTVTFANIQNISVRQGPVQRALGLADLKVDTAGGGAGHAQQGVIPLHTAWFRGVANAAEIRDLISQRLRGQRDSGLGDTDDEVAEPDAERPSVEEIVRELRDEAAALRSVVRRLPGKAV
jgi:uncharacterized membrane protein YdbT with pleckstrin-like domain